MHAQGSGLTLTKKVEKLQILSKSDWYLKGLRRGGKCFAIAFNPLKRMMRSLAECKVRSISNLRKS